MTNLQTIAKGIGATAVAWSASAASFMGASRASSLAAVSHGQEQAAWLVSFIGTLVGVLAGVGGLCVAYWTCRNLAASRRKHDADARAGAATERAAEAAERASVAEKELADQLVSRNSFDDALRDQLIRQKLEREAEAKANRPRSMAEPAD